MPTPLLASDSFRLEFDSSTSLYLGSPLWPGLRLSGLAPALTVDGQALTPAAARLIGKSETSATVEWRFDAPPLLLVQTFSATALGEWRLRTELRNSGDDAVVLNRAVLLRSGSGGASFGGSPFDLRLLHEGGYDAWVRSVADVLAQSQGAAGADEAAFLTLGDNAPTGKQAEMQSMMASVCYSIAERRAFLCGYDTYERWLGHVEFALNDAVGVSAWRMGFDGGDLEVAAGERLPLECAVFLLGQDPWATWERYVGLVAAANDLQSLQRPPVSWCSWYPYRLGVSEDKVLAGAEVGAARLRDLGLSIIEVDLGWEKDWLPSTYEENAQFPHGLGWLAGELERRGLTLGAWKAPYSISEFDSVAQQHPDWLLQGEDGKPLPLGQWFWVPHGETYALDLTHPGAQDYLRRSIKSLADRGVRYIKTDFIGAASVAAGRGRYDRRMVAGGGIEATHRGSQIIAETMKAAAPDALLLNCNPYEGAGLGLYNLLYTCMDTGNTGFVGWQHLRDVYTTTAVHLAKNRRWGIIQPSCLVVGLPGTLEEARARATATFMSGGQVDISDDLPTLPEDRWDVLLATLPTTGLTARPVDLFEPVPVLSLAYEALCRGQTDALGSGEAKVGPRVWHLPIRHEGEEWHALALFEWDQPAERSPLITWFQVPLERLGIDPAGQYWAYEFWSRQFLGTAPKPAMPAGAYSHPGDTQGLTLAGKDGNLEVAFFGPAVKLLLLRKAKPHPWPVGTSFHQSGGLELANVRWDDEAKTLSGRLLRPAGQHGSITIAGALPGPAALLVDGRPIPLRRGANGSLVFDVVTCGGSTEWVVRW